jgi:V/A-type H+-transporting ATPase subunit D
MAKIKHTKNELKTQRDALRRFERYLPTLQLKKQQLQVELRQLDARIEARRSEQRQVRTDTDRWVKLFCEEFDWTRYLNIDSVRSSHGNIAGVAIPVLDEVVFRHASPDLWLTASWVDDGLKALEQLVRLELDLAYLGVQHRLLAAELRTTNQRVNLFEKVKIPEAVENIRVIRIFLGDQMTAAVARSKIAKAKSVEKSVAA